MANGKKLLAGIVCGAILGVAMAVPAYIYLNI